jgi:hypothetical protein
VMGAAARPTFRWEGGIRSVQSVFCLLSLLSVVHFRVLVSYLVFPLYFELRVFVHAAAQPLLPAQFYDIGCINVLPPCTPLLLLLLLLLLLPQAVSDGGTGSTSLYCMVGSAFTPEAIMVQVSLDTVAGIAIAAQAAAQGVWPPVVVTKATEMLTMLATTPLAVGSPLHATLTLTSSTAASGTSQKKAAAAGGTATGAAGGAKKKVLAAPGANKPITFGNKIKSSGCVHFVFPSEPYPAST